MQKPVKIDVLEFVRWLFSRPLLVRAKPMTWRELMLAARLLVQSAPTDDGVLKDALTDLAEQMTTFALKQGTGLIGKPRQVIKTLTQLQVCWARHPTVQRAIDFVNALPPTGVGPTYDDVAQRHGLVYVASDGAMRYEPRIKKKKPFEDDLSERLWMAWATLDEAGCSTEFATIANVLNKQATYGTRWTPQTVRARVKEFKMQPLPKWGECYWHVAFWYERMGSPSSPVPHQQPFVLRWHPAKAKRTPTRHRVTRPR